MPIWIIRETGGSAIRRTASVSMNVPCREDGRPIAARRPLKGPIMMDAPSQPQPRPPSIIDEGPNSPSANAVEAKESVDEVSGSTLAEMADGLRNQIRNDQIRRLDKARKV